MTSHNTQRAPKPAIVEPPHERVELAHGFTAKLFDALQPGHKDPPPPPPPEPPKYRP